MFVDYRAADNMRSWMQRFKDLTKVTVGAGRVARGVLARSSGFTAKMGQSRARG